MKQRLVFAAAAVLLVFGGDVLACGDKFLIVGRGVRYQRGYAAIYPASILLVGGSGIAEKDLLAPLKRAGHRVDVVQNADEIQRAVAAQNYEIVLADWNSAQQIHEVVSSVAPSAVFVPVLHDASAEDVKAATKTYGCPLEASKPKQLNRDFLARLDTVIESKRKSKPLKCNID